jgi:large subunit ribosomal protein L24
MIESGKPRKQRKLRYVAPLSVRKCMMHSHVAKELRAKLAGNPRAVLVRKGDKVRIMVGKNRKKTGKVLEVNYADLKIYVEGITARNAKGTEKPAPISPSNIEIIEGDFTKDRLKKFDRKKQ